MNDYLNLLLESPELIIILVCVVLILAGFTVYFLRKKPKIIDTGTKGVTLTKPSGEVVTVILPTAKILLGTGKVPCAAIRNPLVLELEADANILDFTTMPAPIGELHFADTSCPINGGFYTVIENKDGTISDWNYKSKKIVAEETPEFAYDATHPPDMSPIFRAKYSFYKDSSFWFAIGACVMAFFFGLTAMGA